MIRKKDQSRAALRFVQIRDIDEGIQNIYHILHMFPESDEPRLVLLDASGNKLYRADIAAASQKSRETFCTICAAAAGEGKLAAICVVADPQNCGHRILSLLMFPPHQLPLLIIAVLGERRILNFIRLWQVIVRTKR